MIPSSDRLDNALKAWLNEFASKWGWSPQYAADHMDDKDREIENREIWYPELALLLRRENWTISEFKEIAKQCYTLRDPFFPIRLNRLLEHEHEAKSAVSTLTQGIPENSNESAERINKFVVTARLLGFSKPDNKPDNAGAALLASVLLTALYPWKFVDYRTKRWYKFADLLAYPKLSIDVSYGEKIVWAGDFAKEISHTKTFKKYWSHLGEPYWVIAGLCWHGPEPVKPIFIDEGFSEGRVVERRHKYRERSSKVVDEAKQRAYGKDPLLRCDVCGFSFVETYGDRGEGFIEAHHKIPMAELKEKTRTKVKDLVLICSNCHVMIHRRNPTLTLDELRDMLR